MINLFIYSKKQVLTVFVLIACLEIANAQNKKEHMAFEQGVIAFSEQRYILADSLFSIALNYKKQPDTYFNRGMVRRKIGDEKGFCLDIRQAALMGDKDAKKLYYILCSQRDTVYYNEEDKPTQDIKRCISYEIIERATYEDVVSKRKNSSDTAGYFSIPCYDSSIVIFTKDPAAELPTFPGGADSLNYFIAKMVFIQ